MRTSVLILLLSSLLSAMSFGTTYYVTNAGNGGNDANLGTSSGAPWAHLPGMDGCTGHCATYTAGIADTFYIIGDTSNTYIFHSTWKVPLSGGIGTPVTISGFSGPVIVSGMKTYTSGWNSGGSFGNCSNPNCTLYYRTLSASSIFNFESLFYTQSGQTTPMRRPRPTISGHNRCAQQNDSFVCSNDSTCSGHCPAYGSWQANYPYPPGTVIDDGKNLEVASCQLGLSSCTSGSGSHPTWPTNVYTTTLDNQVTWTLTGKDPTCSQATMTCSSYSYECFDHYRIPPSLISSSTHALNIGDVEIKFHKIWAWSDLRVKSVTTGTDSQIVFTGSDSASGTSDRTANDGCLASKDVNNTLVGNMFMIDNVAENLSPGQWYLDRCPNGCTAGVPESLWKLYIAAASGEDPNNGDTVSIPQLDPASPQLMLLSGNQHLVFTDLIFEGDNYVPPPHGLPDSQGMPFVPAAISCRDCTDVVFGNSVGHGVRIEHTTAKGIEFLGTSTENSFSNSACQDIGAGCVFIGRVAKYLEDTDTNVPSNNTVTDTLCNYPHQLEPSGEGTGCVYIGDSHENIVEHNDCIGALGGCYDLGHGLSRGDSSRTSPLQSSPYDTYFTYGNHVSNNTGQGRLVGGAYLGLLNDVGILYAADNLSVKCPFHNNQDPGTSPSNFCNFIEGNVFHDMATDYTDTDHHQGTCIYLDQGSSYNFVSQNICYRISHEPFFINVPSKDCPGGATDCLYVPLWNHLTNNIVGGCGAAKVAVNEPVRCINDRSLGQHSVTVDHNIFYFNSNTNSGPGTAVQSNPGQWGAFDYATLGHPALNPTQMWDFHNNLYWDMHNAPSFSIPFITCQTDACNGTFNTTATTAWGAVTQWGAPSHFTEDANSYAKDPWLGNPTFGNDDWVPRNSAALTNIGFTTFTPSAGRTDTTIPIIAASNLWPTSSTISPTTDYLPPVTTISPTPGSHLGASSVIFTWTTVSGASSYTLIASSGPGGTGTVFGTCTTSGLSCTVSGLPITPHTLYVDLNWVLTNGTFGDAYTYVTGP